MGRTLFGSFIGFSMLALAVLLTFAVADIDSDGLQSEEQSLYSDTTAYTVTIQCGDYGTVDKQIISDVPSGSAFTVSGNILTINGVSVTATPNQIDAQYTYSFQKWSVKNGDILSGDTTVTASFIRELRYYTVTFINDGAVYYTDSRPYGAMVRIPEDPSRASTDAFDYEFYEWVDYANHQIVKSDLTFTASYIAVLKTFTLVDGTVTLEPNNWCVSIPLERLNEIKYNDDAKKLIIKLTYGTMELNIDTFKSTTSTDTFVSIKLIDKSNLSEDLRAKIGDRPVYSIIFGDVHDFTGNNTFYVKYQLKEEDNPSDIKIWYLKDSQSYQSIGGSYSDGSVKFEVNHLSNFAVVMDHTEASNSSWIWIVAVIVIIAAIGALIYLIKKKAKS